MNVLCYIGCILSLALFIYNIWQIIKIKKKMKFHRPDPVSPVSSQVNMPSKETVSLLLMVAFFLVPVLEAIDDVSWIGVIIPLSDYFAVMLIISIIFYIIKKHNHILMQGMAIISIILIFFACAELLQEKDLWFQKISLLFILTLLIYYIWLTFRIKNVMKFNRSDPNSSSEETANLLLLITIFLVPVFDFIYIFSWMGPIIPLNILFLSMLIIFLFCYMKQIYNRMLMLGMAILTILLIIIVNVKLFPIEGLLLKKISLQVVLAALLIINFTYLRKQIKSSILWSGYVFTFIIYYFLSNITIHFLIEEKFEMLLWIWMNNASLWAFLIVTIIMLAEWLISKKTDGLIALFFQIVNVYLLLLLATQVLKHFPYDYGNDRHIIIVILTVSYGFAVFNGIFTSNSANMNTNVSKLYLTLKIIISIVLLMLISQLDHGNNYHITPPLRLNSTSYKLSELYIREAV